MLISHLKKFIYLKTKKTAGTSLEYYFEKYCMPTDEWIGADDRYREHYFSDTGIIGRRGIGPESEWKGHLEASRIKERIGDAVWDSYFKFHAVRNPYEQAISMFYWKRIWEQKLTAGTTIQEQAEFEKWLSNGGYKSDTYIYLINGEFISDDYIRYENLNTDLARICNKLEVPFVPEQLKFFGKNLRPAESTAMAMYTDISKNIIKSVCKFELDYFGYTFPTN